MKISSTTLDSSTQSTTPDSQATSDPALNEALFNQILQLMVTLPAVPEPDDNAETAMNAISADNTAPGQVVNNLPFFEKILQEMAAPAKGVVGGEPNNVPDSMMPPVSADPALDKMIAGQLTDTIPQTTPAMDMLKATAAQQANIPATLAKQFAAMEKTMTPEQGAEPVKTIASNSLNNQAVTGLDAFASSLTDSSNLLTKSNQVLDLPQSMPKPEITQESVQKQVTAAAALPGALEADMSKPAINLVQDALALPVKMKPEENNKFATALVNLGQLINSRTAQLNPNGAAFSASSQSASSQSQSASAFNYFDPAHDVRLNVSTTSLGSQLQQIHDAKIKIYPPELGHIIAKLRVDKNNAELIIMTENNQVKEIVESNLPMLRQHFQEASINLGQIQVQTNQSGGKDAENNQSRQQEAVRVADETVFGTSKLTKHEAKKSDDAIIDTYA